MRLRRLLLGINLNQRGASLTSSTYLMNLSQARSRTFLTGTMGQQSPPGLQDCNSRVQIRVDPVELRTRFHKRRYASPSDLVGDGCEPVPGTRSSVSTAQHGHLAVLAGTQGQCNSDTGCSPASHIASRSLPHPAIIGVHPRPPFTAAAALSGVPEITDTEEVTGSNPVSPTSKTPSQPLLLRAFGAGWLTCRPKTVGLSIDSVTGMRPRSR